MPYAELKTLPTPTPEQAKVLAQGITDALVEVAAKRREVTAVHIASSDARLWTVGGETSGRAIAYLDVKITTGSNSREQKGKLIERLHTLLKDVFGELAEASYIVIHELPAESWGYAGISQAARFGSRP
jgi:4-oxalocrotonate tautomerase